MRRVEWSVEILECRGYCAVPFFFVVDVAVTNPKFRIKPSTAARRERSPPLATPPISVPYRPGSLHARALSAPQYSYLLHPARLSRVSWRKTQSDHAHRVGHIATKHKIAYFPRRARACAPLYRRGISRRHACMCVCRNARALKHNRRARLCDDARAPQHRASPSRYLKEYLCR